MPLQNLFSLITIPPAVYRFLRAPLMTIFRLVLAILLGDSAPRQFPQRPVLNSYDFVVVGGGTAGCVVASRLATAGATVLVLEVGGPAPPETAIPGLWPLVLGGEADWHLRTASHPFSQQGFNENSSILHLGKMMGGSSSMSYFLYSRGHPSDYDGWAAMGNRGWAYEDVLPYFIKIEGFVKNESLGSANETLKTMDKFGEKGPLRVIPKNYRSDIGDLFLSAGEELGYAAVNPNAPHDIGFSGGHLLLRGKIRETTAQSHAARISSKENFHVKTEAIVTKIVFEGKRAVGVRYRTSGPGNNRKHTVMAKKEVILCAGAIHSPKLLMLSGVGPENHIRSKRIPVVASLEGVGQNLQDHHTILHFPFVSKNITGVAFKATTDFANIKYFFKRGEGHLTRPFGLDGVASVSLGLPRSERPNVHVSLYSSVLPFDKFQSFTELSLSDDMYNQVVGDIDTENSISLIPSLSRPLSKGWVLLDSNNPNDNPVVDFNFLSHPEDIDLIVKAIRFCFKIADTRTMQEAAALTFAPQKVKQCASFPDDSDAYWECFARHVLTTANHPVGTCKMGPEWDQYSVVSDTLKVRGVSRLRVVDASVMPRIVSAPPMAATIMIAEKAADLIVQEWGYSMEVT